VAQLNKRIAEMLRLLLITLIFYISNSYAIDQFYHKKAEGWFWYEELLRAKANQQLDNDNHVTQEPTDPVAVIENYQQQLDFNLKQALVAPTIPNVASYLKMQQQLFRNASSFANTWKRTLMYYPELDPTVKQPISHLGRQIYLNEHQEYISNKMKEVAKDYGLLFFFKSQCSYCHEFAKTVNNFAKQYGLEVLAITLDGKSIPEYPNAKTNNGISERLNIYAVPALMLTNPKSGQMIPITFGLISEQELIDRISLVLNLGGKQ